MAPALAGCGWPDLALIAVAAGVGEEMLFRGVIQGALARPLGPIAAVAAAGAVFGLFHPVSTAYVVVAGLLGAYLGLVWLATGNLLAAMVAHAVYDFVALLALLHDHRKAARD
ncbi:MAG: CPBP family intramembrane metalloprotease [Planctomycetia bacterium]|nr:CPBP family intramembrane metalloprotease [Planctomycetia bacterium]